MNDAALVIRADAGPAIGTGHVMRCLALADGFRRAVSEKARIRFVASGGLPAALQARLDDDGYESSIVEPSAFADAGVMARFAEEVGATWVVVDGYGFDAAFETGLARAGFRVLALDDFVHTRHTAEIVVNQNLHAARAAYEPVSSGTRFLLGPSYALIRREFAKYREARRVHASRARKILVTLGGSDPGHVAPKVLRGLEPLGVEVRVIVGSADTERERTTGLARELGFEALVAPGDMSVHLAWADLAVASAGVTLLEMCCAGTPSLLVVAAENQRPGALEAEARGLARLLGWHEAVTPETVTARVSELIDDRVARQAMEALGRDTVDGFGAERVCRVMAGTEAKEIRLRVVEPGDRSLLWDWANDEGTRQGAFDDERIAWEDHVAWFSRKLADPSCSMFLAEVPDEGPVGVVRFDVAGETAVLSITVAPAWRGRGLAARLIDRAVVRFFRSTATATVTALVKPDNAPSLKAFARARFVRAASPRTDALCFVRKRISVRGAQYG